MDGIRGSRFAAQVGRFRARFAQAGSSTLSKLMPASLLEGLITQSRERWRDRIYGPLQTLKLFLDQVLSADGSCQDAVARGLSERTALGLAPCSLNNAAYCVARRRLPLSLIVGLAQTLGERLEQSQPKQWLWRGRPIVLADGTTVSMPDTTANQARFPQSGEQQPGLGFPLARLVALVSLSTGAVLGWASGPCKGKQTSEMALLWRLAGQLKRGDVMIADRFYASYLMLAHLRSLGVDVVMRQHQRRRTDFRRGQRLGKGDHVVCWARPKRPPWMSLQEYDAIPETMRVRETRHGCWIIVTTMLDVQEVDKAELLRLYRLRWQIELDLRSIKSVMQMDVLRCRSPEMIEKEIAAYLCAYNLVRTVMAQAAAVSGCLPRLLSFTAALQVLRAFEQTLRHAPGKRLRVVTACVLGAVAQAKLPLRPDRAEPRARKRRPKKARLLTEPRECARERLLKHKETQMAELLS